MVIVNEIYMQNADQQISGGQGPFNSLNRNAMSV